jgi:hypothetical protein
MYNTKGVGNLIAVEKIPKSGVLIVTVNFADYKDNYANDTRRILGGGDKQKGLVDEVEEKGIGVDLIPLNYWLGRTIVDKVTRSTGGLYKFGYSNMTPKSFEALYSLLKEKKKKYDWWESVEILIGNRVEGFE